MKTQNLLTYCFLCLLLASCVSPPETEQRIPPRQMGVNVGPELVFDRPVEQIIPDLANAAASGENGRVGNELVFWGYQLADGNAAFFFACGMFDKVDCQGRIAAICPSSPSELISSQVTQGKVRHLDCKAIGTAGIGDLLPNCLDQQRSNDLLVGLVSCP